MTVLRAKISFSAGRRTVRRRALVDARDPIITGREHLFEPIEDKQPVEQATAAPGEKRTVRRTRKKKKK